MSRRWVWDYRISVVAGALAVMLVTSTMVAQTPMPGLVERNLVTVVSAIGVLWVGWWRIGRLEKDFERSIAERERLKGEYLRLDQFNSYRELVESKLDEMITRIDGLHQSVREIRKVQLHRHIIDDKVEEAGP